MAINAARQYQQAAGIDLARGALDPVRQGHDAAVADADIAAKFVACGDDGTAADCQVELRHVPSPPVCLLNVSSRKSRPQSPR